MRPEKWSSLLSQGRPVAETLPTIGVTAFTHYRWRKEFGDLKSDQVKQQKEIEKETEQPRKAVSDTTLEKPIPAMAATATDHTRLSATPRLPSSPSNRRWRDRPPRARNEPRTLPQIGGEKGLRSFFLRMTSEICTTTIRMFSQPIMHAKRRAEALAVAIPAWQAGAITRSNCDSKRIVSVG